LAGANTHEGYVSWEQFEQIQQAIASNDRGWEHSGAVQEWSGFARRPIALSPLWS
jgi:hypothetical protein